MSQKEQDTENASTENKWLCGLPGSESRAAMVREIYKNYAKPVDGPEGLMDVYVRPPVTWVPDLELEPCHPHYGIPYWLVPNKGPTQDIHEYLAEADVPFVVDKKDGEE